MKEGKARNVNGAVVENLLMLMWRIIRRQKANEKNQERIIWAPKKGADEYALGVEEGLARDTESLSNSQKSELQRLLA